MREGSLEAPVRHPIAWQDEAFYDPAAIDAELRRVFDVCHTCRRCFNLCDSFPRLFDLIDASKTGELDAVDSKDFGPVVDACTLCDMCFMTKCPYVPPHEFNIDFPASDAALPGDGDAAGQDQLRRPAACADRPQRPHGEHDAPAWRTGRPTAATRPCAACCGTAPGCIRMPSCRNTAARRCWPQAKVAPEVNRAAPAFGRKAVLYATCFGNYNEPAVGLATRAVLAKLGVETEVVYPHCCGMPLLEQGRLAEVADAARIVAGAMQDWIDKGYDVIALVPSCALMLKFEWPLILPDDAQVKTLSKATYDISEYVVDIARKEGLVDGMQPHSPAA